MKWSVYDSEELSKLPKSTTHINYVTQLSEIVVLPELPLLTHLTMQGIGAVQEIINIPPTVTHIACRSALSCKYGLPSNLLSLISSGLCHYPAIPFKLPQNLTHVSIVGNFPNNKVPVLPPTITHLKIDDMMWDSYPPKLTHLIQPTTTEFQPPPLPPTLKYLEISKHTDYKNRSFACIPNSITVLKSAPEYLTELPPNLTHFYCHRLPDCVTNEKVMAMCNSLTHFQFARGNATFSTLPPRLTHLEFRLMEGDYPKLPPTLTHLITYEQPQQDWDSLPVLTHFTVEDGTSTIPPTTTHLKWDSHYPLPLLSTSITHLIFKTFPLKAPPVVLPSSLKYLQLLCNLPLPNLPNSLKWLFIDTQIDYSHKLPTLPSRLIFFVMYRAEIQVCISN